MKFALCRRGKSSASFIPAIDRLTAGVMASSSTSFSLVHTAYGGPSQPTFHGQISFAGVTNSVWRSPGRIGVQSEDWPACAVGVRMSE